MEKTIYQLELHESLLIKTVQNGEPSISFRVTRVPGGWIYRSTYEKAVSIVFVPYTNS